MEQTISNDTKKLILLVEDQMMLAMVEIRHLEAAGFAVHHVLTGEEAIEYVSLNENDVDLILMDIDLGDGIDGTVAAKTILEKHTLPLVFLSLHSEVEVVQKTESITSFGYILKSSGEVMLIASIKMALRLFESYQTRNEAQQLFEKAFYVSPIAMSIHDIAKDFRYVNINPAFAKLVGYTAEEVLGKTSQELNLYENINDREEIKRLMIENGRLISYPHRFRIKSGEIREGSLSMEIVDIQGKPHALTFQNRLFT
ncbi:response regulator [Leptospira perdikensis]|uniref:Response regulator n=1 Tax=Leptospira perdikensis TaxID=2484948 RepID=A0A4R9J5H8_9LEPT|nr:response regulator [Leptospira perdikensis]TGL33501.1 response regulator [Leptospira perdikensis]